MIMTDELKARIKANIREMARKRKAETLERLKANIIEVVKFHYAHCGADSNCCCSLNAVRELAELAGCQFTVEEKRHFC